MKSYWWSVFGIALGLFAACSRGPSESPGRSAPGPGGTSQALRPVAEHRPQNVPAPRKQLGEDCTVAGYSDCISKLCVHVQPAPSAGYFCTTACTGDSDCPADWACRQTYPGPEGQLCLPPSGWDGRVARPRPTPEPVDDASP